LIPAFGYEIFTEAPGRALPSGEVTIPLIVAVVTCAFVCKQIKARHKKTAVFILFVLINSRVERLKYKQKIKTQYEVY
jgi:hypothetical protein